ncbi:MAG: adenosylcobinamide-phosphate synthase CbiB [Alphaproteobacteria bacterium]|uniref:Cobalamin biosynthesis protein CobD n=1 Tax=Candidatus Nitrobium versatile TaxID=2884831 RepID=A0A953SGW2_9BACT|nr:adenosylcobinamide-phosphate synthase CbiB [Candidatus Nitrobium versatile]
MSPYQEASPLFVSPFVLVAALLLDGVMGDPRWMPHPVRCIGNAICRTEAFLRRFFRTPSQELRAGLLLVLLIVPPVFLVTYFINFLLLRMGEGAAAWYSPLSLLSLALLVFLTATTVATRELIRSAHEVMRPLQEGDLETARRNLGMIVGRDTHALTEREVLKATMETLAENLSDGIIAPVFYLTLGGLPLAMAYKAVNTLDSMVGYKNERYLHFGRAAARLDDAANFVPARISGILIVIASWIAYRSLAAARDSWETMLRDGGKHASPNSGVPEAAMAGAIGVRMGGPSTYGGMLVEKPYIGETKIGDHAAAFLSASESTVRIVKIASLLSGAAAAIILAARNSL